MQTFKASSGIGQVERLVSRCVSERILLGIPSAKRDGRSASTPVLIRGRRQGGNASWKKRPATGDRLAELEAICTRKKRRSTGKKGAAKKKDVKTGQACQEKAACHKPVRETTLGRNSDRGPYERRMEDEDQDEAFRKSARQVFGGLNTEKR